MPRLGKIVIGTRGSPLAMRQSEMVRDALAFAHKGIEIKLRVIRTTGDVILDSPLSMIGDKGLFTRQIERALLDNEVDLAVHSLKDLPTAVGPGLEIGAITKREDPRDAAVIKGGGRLETLPNGARVATSSLRRRAQILHFRPDFAVEDIRGNVDTRLRKLDETPGLSAVILASAGLARLGLSGRITHLLETDTMLPAVGQGALGIEIRKGDHRMTEIVSVLHHHETAAGVLAERALLARLEGGCQVPIGAFGRIEGNRLALDGLAASPDGSRLIRAALTGDPDDPESLGRALAEELIALGADRILQQVRAVGREAK